jgi:hypothetical protein
MRTKDLLESLKRRDYWKMYRLIWEDDIKMVLKEIVLEGVH